MGGQIADSRVSLLYPLHTNRVLCFLGEMGASSSVRLRLGYFEIGLMTRPDNNFG